MTSHTRALLTRAIKAIIREGLILSSCERLISQMPMAPILIAKEILPLIGQATILLKRIEIKEEEIIKASEELEKALKLLSSIVSEKPSLNSTTFKNLGWNYALLLDEAHYRIHKALKHIQSSKILRQDDRLSHIISTLCIARRSTSPSTLYKLAYELIEKSLNSSNN